ncbi:hypothetical protein ACFL5Z_18855 [Planctomycetota bacterium]
MIRSLAVHLILTINFVVLTTTGFAAEGASEARLMPPVNDPIRVSIAPHELSGSASMRPGTYLMDEPLRLHITSNNPGWYMQVHATNLKSDDDEIGPEDIHIETKQGAVALDQPQVVAQDGDIGETTIDVLIELQTTQRHLPGTYVGELFLIAGCIGGPPPEVIKLPFEVEVACSVSGSISGNKMYFHYGLPGKSLSAIAEGEISADADVCLSLSVEKGRVDTLPLVRPFSGKKQWSAAYAIPLVWALRANGAGWREPDTVAFHGNEISWELAADSQKVFYELQCSPQPDAAQAAGDYAMRVVLTVVPIL